MLDDMPLVREPLEDLAAARVNAVVYLVPGRPTPAASAARRVHDFGFAPLACLLPRVDAVVCVGGMGTILAVLANGLPVVSMPRFPGQQ